MRSSGEELDFLRGFRGEEVGGMWGVAGTGVQGKPVVIWRDRVQPLRSLLVALPEAPGPLRVLACLGGWYWPVTVVQSELPGAKHHGGWEHWA